MSSDSAGIVLWSPEMSAGYISEWQLLILVKQNEKIINLLNQEDIAAICNEVRRLHQQAMHAQNQSPYYRSYDGCNLDDTQFTPVQVMFIERLRMEYEAKVPDTELVSNAWEMTMDGMESQRIKTALRQAELRERVLSCAFLLDMLLNGEQPPSVN